MDEQADNELERALGLYDVVININSLSGIKNGWCIYGNKGRRYGKHYGRAVALIGPFKVGKTWLASKLAGLELLHSQTVPTLGISMKLPATSSTTAPVRDGNAPPVKATKKIAVGIAPQPKAKTSPAPLEGVIVLDTAGTDRPVHDNILRESLSLEYFLREITIEIAGRVILVISKFDKPTQVMVRSLIQQIDNKHPATPIGQNRRLVIVHNLRDVESDKVLNDKIEEVRSVYYEQESDDQEHSWLDIPFESIFFYNTKKITHIFFVKDSDKTEGWENKPIPFKASCGKEYNSMALKKLQAILGEDNVKSIDIIEEVRQRAVKNLPRYLRHWEGYDLKLVKATQEGEDDDSFFPCVDKDVEEVDAKACEKYLKEVDIPWKLEDVTFTDKGIISESYFSLEGEVRFETSDNKGKSNPGRRFIEVNIKAAGMTEQEKNQKFIKISIKDNKSIIITLTIPKRDEFLYSSIRFGKGFFEYTLPGEIRYEIPGSIKELYENHLSLNNGMLTLKLKEQMPLPDTSEEDE